MIRLCYAIINLALKGGFIMTRKEYILKVKEYAKKNNISLQEYFYRNAKKIRSNKKFTLESFELENPFITEKDIQKLISAKDDRIEQYYAHAMTKAIKLYEEKEGKEEIQKRLYEAMDAKRREEEKKKMILLSLPEKKKNTSMVPKGSTAMIPYKKKQEALEPYGAMDKWKMVPKNAEETKGVEPLDRNAIVKIVNEEIDKKSKFGVVLKSISRKIIDTLKGFALIRESKTGRTTLYYHDPETDTLKGKAIISNIKERLNSGYYVNYQEYVENIMTKTIEENPNMTKITMVREDGRENTFGEVVEEGFRIANNYGVIKLGNEIKDKEVKSYEELRRLQLDGEEEVAGEKLRKGIYVRRDVISRIFDKYKMRIESKEIEEEKKKTSTK